MTTESQIVRPGLTIDLDYARFDKVAKAHDWKTGGGNYAYDVIAAALNLSARQVMRILDRESRPGTSFIAEALTAADEVGFRRLFRIVNSADPIGKD